MALMSKEPVTIGDEELEDWNRIGSGGFGDVFKARHKDWGFNVAIKLIRTDAGQLSYSGPYMPHEQTVREANYMEKVSCEFVLRVYGLYRGTSMQQTVAQGIVMEWMRRGSIATLQKKLVGPPPWPLAVRLAHEVALGMNFLHSKGVVHRDLKPSNVLLNDDLHAKLADFGLSKVSTSVLNNTGETTGGIHGTFKYMPPEAFDASYKPGRPFDRYSYGILLWSIFTGKEPYEDADYNLVAFRIPKGDRPPCEEMKKKGMPDGLKDIIDLMKTCWHKDVSERPTFKKCCEVCEKVLEKHEGNVPAAVYDVLERLKSPTSNQQPNTSGACGFTPQMAESQSEAPDTVDFPESVVQNRDSVSARNLTTEEKANFICGKRTVLIQRVSEVMAIVDELGDMVNEETYSIIHRTAPNAERMRLLYQGTLKSGNKVKAAFYDALQKHHPDLMEDLGG